MTYGTRFYRDAYGTGENILSMATGSIAEPVSGIAALMAAAQGYDARGARDAIREKMTYQPRSAAGIEQAQMLARLAQGVIESAPVRTWQRGVDIAGRYSPTAGAALQTVPTAIGVAAGYKPTMAQGRAASMLAEQMQKRMVQNAMVPRTLHPQAGVINFGGKVYEPGARIHSQRDVYEYLGDTEKPYLVKARDIRTGDETVISKRAITAMSDKPQPKEAIYSNQGSGDKYVLTSIVDATKPVGKEDLLDLYHGSGLHDQDFLDVVDDPYTGGFNYGALFASPDEIASLSHGGKLYKTSVNRKDVLYGDSAAYNTSDRKIQSALKDVVGKLDNDSMELAYEAIVLDKDIGDEGLRKVFGNGYLDHEYGLAQQAARAKFAGKLGYKAVSTNDEHGMSYMILPGHRLERVRK